VGFTLFIGHEGPRVGIGYSSTLSRTSALDRGGGSALRPGHIHPRERPGTHCTGGKVGPRAGLDRCGKPRLHRVSIPGTSSPYPVAIPTTLPGPPREDVGHAKRFTASQCVIINTNFDSRRGFKPWATQARRLSLLTFI